MLLCLYLFDLAYVAVSRTAALTGHRAAFLLECPVWREGCIFTEASWWLRGLGSRKRCRPPWQWIRSDWRCPAYHYAGVREPIRAAGIADLVPRWQPLASALTDERVPRDYQEQALSAWEAAQMRGVVVLPTGSGKTLVALRAIQRVNRSAIVACPTIDLLHQWFLILRHAFSCEIGVYYGEKRWSCRSP